MGRGGRDRANILSPGAVCLLRATTLPEIAHTSGAKVSPNLDETFESWGPGHPSIFYTVSHPGSYEIHPPTARPRGWASLVAAWEDEACSGRPVRSLEPPIGHTDPKTSPQEPRRRWDPRGGCIGSVCPRRGFRDRTAPPTSLNISYVNRSA